MKNRIIGIDLARALAVIGMVIVNFKIVLGETGNHWLKSVAGIFDGKAAATFVVLAGVGLALMTHSARENNVIEKWQLKRKSILKRALFLFIVGLTYMSIWPADILHFYGIYMLVLVLVLKQKPAVLLWLTIGLVFSFPLLMYIFNYESGWDFDTLTYIDFWTIEGFLRNLFFNGFHPVLPWVAFMVFGYWFGQLNLNDVKLVRQAFWLGLIGLIGVQIISHLAILLLSGGSEALIIEWAAWLGTEPMPPLPLYMLNGLATAVTIISACILLGKRYPKHKIIMALSQTGQLALTFYVAHVIIGMGVIEVIDPSKIGQYSIVFSVSYAVGFSLICIVFAVIWRKYKSAGPLEWLMRRLAGS